MSVRYKRILRSGQVYCHTHFQGIMAISYMCRRLMLGQRQHLRYISQIHHHLLLVLVRSPVRFTMLTETIPLYFCLITQCPSSYLHRFLGKSLAEWAVLLRHRMMSLWNNVCEAALAKSPQLPCGLPLHTRLAGHGVKLLLHMWWDN